MSLPMFHRCDSPAAWRPSRRATILRSLVRTVMAGASLASAVAADSRLAIERPTADTTQLTLTGETGRTYEVQVSTNLDRWERQAVVPLTASPLTYADPDAASASHRFYRLLALDPVDPGVRRFLLGLGGTGPIASLPFANQTMTGGDRQILAVDPAAPMPPAVVVPAGQYSGDTVNFIHQNSILEATVDPDTGLHTDTRVRFTVYARDNRLWKFDHLGGPGGEPWTTLTTPEVCTFSYTLRRVAPDFADARRSWMFFVAPGPSGNCFAFPDDTRVLGLRLDMGPDDPPRRVPIPLAPLYAADGALTGFVAQDADKVQRVDPDFGNPTTLFTVPNPPIVLNGVTNYTTYNRGFLFGRSAPGRWLYLGVHNFLTEYLMGFDLAGGGSPVPILRVPSTSSGNPAGTLFGDWTDTDGAHVFLALNEGPTRSVIVRIAEDFSVQRLATNTAAVHELALTDTHVIVRSDKTLRALPKSGGEPRLLTTLAADEEFVPKFRTRRGARTVEHPTLRVRRFLTGGGNVWFETTVGRSVPSQHEVRVIDAGDPNATVERLADRSLITWVAPDAAPWCAEPPARAVYLANRRIPTPPTDLRRDLSGLPLRAHDAATRAVVVEVGTFPTATLTLGTTTAPTSVFAQEVLGEPFHWGQPGLIPIQGRPLTPTGQPAGVDLLLFRSDTPGLVPVTGFGID